MLCRDCVHYLSSEDPNRPRSGLAGYGYCKAGATPELRARFFPETTGRCWLPETRYQERKP